MNDVRSAEAIALEYIVAAGARDFDRVERLLHPDLLFQSPSRTMHGAAEYLAALRRLAPIMLRNSVKQSIVDGDDVCIVYDFVTDTAVGAVPTVEWVTVEAGRIRTVRLIFHRARWPEVAAELNRRMSGATRG